MIETSTFREKYGKKPVDTRVIVTSNIYESNRYIKRIKRILNMLVIGYEFRPPTGLRFYFPRTDTVTEVIVTSNISNYWVNIPKEKDIVREIVCTKQSIEGINKIGKLDLFNNYTNKVSLTEDPLVDDLIQMMLRGHDIVCPEGRETTKNFSISQRFNFPVSLYREEMEEYFLDSNDPKIEEFLLALMMENISGNTEEEKKAIEEAHIYVKGKIE